MQCHLICGYIKLHSGFLLTVYMSKVLKDYIVYTIVTFNAMLKGSKDYVMYTIKIHSMLCQKG